MAHHARVPVTLWWGLLFLGALAGAVFVGGEFVPDHHQALEPYLSNLPIVPAYLIAVFLYLRRPGHPVARRLLVLGASPLIALGLGEILSLLWLTVGRQPWYWLLGVAGQIAELAGVAGGVALVAVFPDGAYQRRYERWIVAVAAAQVLVLPVLLLLCSPVLHYDVFMVWARPTIESPLYQPALGGLAEVALSYYDSVFVWALVAAVVLTLRYRRLSYELRLQVKWPLWAAICFAGSVVVASLHQAALVPYWLSQSVWYVTLPLFPLCIAIALLRYRLLDIDVVIRKSLVYGVLWLAILSAYLSLAWALGLAAKERLPIELAILLTIVATMVFQPARRRLEHVADRWVFGERLSGYHALQKLGAALETTVDPAVLGLQLATTVKSALGLRWVRISAMRSGGDETRLQPIGWDGIASDMGGAAELVVPLEHRKELIGVIECGPKNEGVLDQRDRDLLGALARQAALALRNARLTADLTDHLEFIQAQARELTASRVRIVQAQDEERRRIQRDLHDGVQQHLVTLAAGLRRVTTSGEEDLKVVVQTLAKEAEETVFALQDFSNGIYPSVLSDEGLPAALWTHAQRIPVSVVLRVAPDLVGLRFDREVEAALYFVALEAIVNSQKHGLAEKITVTLTLHNADLRLEVADEGHGMRMEAGTRGLGLTNMKDRVAALGGSLQIESKAGVGTRVIASVPIGPKIRAPEGTLADRSALPTPSD
jgi:signal transduction histidine kinase